jgi:hypothetical protein
VSMLPADIHHRLDAKPIHPVDALKALGAQMTPEAEAAARVVCDSPAYTFVDNTDTKRGPNCAQCVALRDDSLCISLPCMPPYREDDAWGFFIINPTKTKP